MKYLSLVALVGLSLVGTAEAACTQASAKGTWMTYQAAFVGTPDGAQHVGQCKLVLDKMGIVQEFGKDEIVLSSCTFYLDTVTAGPFSTSGQVTVNKDCSVTIGLTLGDFVGQAYMTTSKNAWTGRFSVQDNDGISGVTNAVKIAN